jgi:hypothetical protein
MGSEIATIKTEKKPYRKMKRVWEEMMEYQASLPLDGEDERQEQFIPWDGKHPAEWEQEPDDRKQ